MGNNIRIGKDFNVQWAINKVVDGERLPYDLVGKELQLYIVNDNGRKEVAGWKVQDNVIEWTYLGKDQRRLGAYQLVLVENAGKEGMVTVDTCKAFNLVEHSCEENVDGGSDIVIKTVTLESEVALAPVVKEGPSYDDTEIKERLEEQDQLIEDLQNMKIDREADDYYPKLAVGLADNLAGVDVVDSEINFRRSGGGAITDGVARIESIKGNSVVWNQLIQRTYKTTTHNGVTFTVNEDGSVVANGTATAFAYLAVKRISVYVTHKYCVIGGIDNSSATTYYFGDGNNLNLYNTKYVIANPLNNATVTLACRVMQGVTVENIKFDVPKFFDLTQMFGAGNEPTTIDEFYARIPMGVDLNAYNEGEVIHMDVQSIESQGVNAWDEEIEMGALYPDGSIDPVNTRITTSFIPVIPNKTYYQFSPNSAYNGRVAVYDENKVVIYTDLTNGITLASKTFTTPSNAKYMRITFGTAYGTTYNHDICINISDASINGKYFPYIKRVEDLSIIRKYFPQGMKSAGSAHDEIRYNKTSGKWEKVVRIGEVDMGTLNWKNLDISNGMFWLSRQEVIDLNMATHDNENIPTNLMSSLYASVPTYDIVNIDKVFRGPFTTKFSGYLTVKDKAYTDVASFKAAMQGVMLYYELAEPIVTELDEADQFKDLDYQVWNAGTEKAIAEGKSAPLAADITYGFNAIGKIKELESLVAALRAKVGDLVE